jgi:thioredoxin reductase
MEEACFLTRYASTVYIIHRFDFFEASRVMQKRALTNPKVKVSPSRQGDKLSVQYDMLLYRL